MTPGAGVGGGWRWGRAKLAHLPERQALATLAAAAMGVVLLALVALLLAE